MAENALVSGASVGLGLGASVLTWDCATHLPNGFLLREGEDTPPHVAPISPSKWSSLPSPCSSQAPGTLTTPGLCTQPVPVFIIASFFSLSYIPGEVSHLTACLKSLGQAHRHCYQSLLRLCTVTCWVSSLLAYPLLLGEGVSM